MNPANDAPPYMLPHLLCASRAELKGVIAHAAGLLMDATSPQEAAEVLSNVRGAIIARATMKSANHPTFHVPVTQTVLAETLKTVARHTSVTPDELMRVTRVRRISRARQYAMWLLRQRIFPDGRPKHSLSDIARAFGKDHSTVIWALAACEERLRMGAAA